MKTATNRTKSLCKRDGKDASSACHWRNWKASESAIRPPRPSPTGIAGAPTGIVSNHLADFAVNGFQDPLSLLPSQIERLSAFESSRHCPWQVPVCPERIFRLASSWILASAYTPAASQSPPPSNGAWPENIRFDKTIVFPNSLSFADHYRVALPQQCLYFLPEPQPQGSLRPIFRSAWR